MYVERRLDQECRGEYVLAPAEWHQAMVLTAWNSGWIGSDTDFHEEHK